MPRIKIIKAPKIPKAEFGINASMIPGLTSFAANVTKNAPEEDAKAGRMADQPYYNPFDVKWGQKQDPLPTDMFSDDLTRMSGSSNKPFDPYATSVNNSNTASKGSLNLPQLVNPNLLSKDKKTDPSEKAFTNTAGWLNSAIDMGGAAINYFDNKRKQKEYDNWARQSRLPDNYYAVNTTQDRGDYDQYGTFRPDDTGYKSKGTQANAYYPQQNFSRNGGMIKAAEGITVPGDYAVHPAFIPETRQPIIPNNRQSVVSAPTFKPSNEEQSSGDLREIIAAKESGGNYEALPKKKDGTLASSAVGKYQFLWNQNKDWIEEVTGVTTKTGFMHNPEAQEKAFDYWDQNVLTPNAIKIKKELGVNAPIENIKYAIHFAGPTGAYKYFATGKETNDVFGTNVGKIMNMNLSNNQQAQNKNNMKVRIIGTPDEQFQMAYGGQPPYSGQSDYGLYIGQRNLYKTMAKHPYDDVKSTVSEEPETPDNPHVLEAEDGEIITKPDGTTSKIVGNRHYEGGEKLNKEQAPEGSFIFSDTAKMKIGGRALANFGKSANSKKKYTPAELAKQYDVNKYKAILADPTTDNLQKNTAKRMLDAYEQKLAELALVQEGKKGFPQGVPDIAKPLMEKLSGGANGMEQAEGENPEEEQMEQPPMQYGGGLKKFQGIIGGSTVRNVQYNNKNYLAPQVAKDYDLSGYNQYESIPSGSVYLKPGQPGYTAAGSYNQAPVRGSAPWKPFVKSLAEKGMTYEDLVKHNPGVGRFVNDRPEVKAWWQQNYKAIPGKTVPATDPSFVYQQEPIGSTTGGGGSSTTTSGGNKNEMDYTVKPNDFTPGEGKYPPYGWTQQDVNNVGAAATNLSLIDKYNMASRSIQPVLPEFIPTDWRGYAATQQSGLNSAANQLGTYQPGQGMASNLSFLAGQQAGALGDYISKVDQYNASGASNMDLQRANILNTASQYNASKRDYDMDYNNTADARYKAALAHGLDRLTAANNQGITNAAMLYDMNVSESPEYYIDPRFQKRKFNSTQAYWDFVNRNKAGYQDPNGSNEIAIYNDAYDRAKGTAAEKHAAALEAMKLQGSRGRSTNTAYPYNPMRNKISTSMPMAGGYPQPGYNGYGYDYSSAYPGYGS
jgi:hypothetical protein